jgi:hypothetical protein
MKEIFYNIIGFGALMGAIAIVILEVIIVGFIYFIEWLKNRKEK